MLFARTACRFPRRSSEATPRSFSFIRSPLRGSLWSFPNQYGPSQINAASHGKALRTQGVTRCATSDAAEIGNRRFERTHAPPHRTAFHGDRAFCCEVGN